jgi:hypothetical protein
MDRTLRISAVATATVAAFAGVSLGSATTPAATSLAAARPAAVCGASFKLLPRHWHQSGAPRALIIGGEVPSNTDSWAATPRSVWDLTKPLPRGGIYIWVDLSRPKGGPTGKPLRLPLLLRKALVIGQEGAPRLPEYRIEGRYRHQYDVILGVDFGRASPPPRLRRLADRVLRQLVLPRWVPFPRRSSC